MLHAHDLLTLAGASTVTSAIYFVLHQLRATLPRAPLILAISQIVVWSGGLLEADVTVQSAVLMVLNGFIVAAASLAGVYGVVDRFLGRKGSSA
jgi:hypothetical protein